MDFVNFSKLKKTKVLEVFELPDKQGFKPTAKRREDSFPSANLHS